MSLVAGLLSLSGPPAYAVVAALVAGEAAVLLGVVLPGEAALLLAGVLVSRGTLHLPVLLAVAAAAAVAGDTVGYAVGRRLGPALQDSRAGRLVGPARWARAERLLAERGGPAVLLGRWVGVLRALVPGLAGAGRMPYRTFLLWNAVGGLLWSWTVVLLGVAAGDQYRRVAGLLGRGGLALGGVVAAVAGLLLLVHHLRGRRPAPPARHPVRTP